MILRRPICAEECICLLQQWSVKTSARNLDRHRLIVHYIFPIHPGDRNFGMSIHQKCLAALGVRMRVRNWFHQACVHTSESGTKAYLFPRLLLCSETAQHGAGHSRSPRLLYTSHGHAHMTERSATHPFGKPTKLNRLTAPP